MPARKRPPDEPGTQSRRFLEAAQDVGADESGRKFERAFKKLVPAKKALAKRR